MDIKEPKSRSLFFAKEVDQDSISELSKKIIEINEDDEKLAKIAEIQGFKYDPKPIKIYIDSYGGAVYQILGVMAIIEKSTTPVHTICTGVAMSCGFMLLISGHKRFCYKYSTPLYHQISMGLFGNLKEAEEYMTEVKRKQELFETIIVEKTAITKKKLKEINDKKFDWYMTPKEALDLSVIDEIIE